MKRFFAITSLLISGLSAGAQQVDGVLANDLYEGTLNQGLEERVLLPANSQVKLSHGLLKNLPFLKQPAFSVTQVNKYELAGVISGEKQVYKRFKAEYRRHHLHGVWSSRYQSGALADSGRFENNMPDGEWISWYANGKVRSIRNYNATKWFALKNEWQRQNPKAQFHSSKNQAQHRQRIVYSSNATRSFASVNAVAEPYQPPFTNGLHHGLYMNYYASGAVKDSGYYKDGWREGLWQEFFESGQMRSSGTYYQGLKNAGWKYFDEKGNLVALAEYKDGNLVHRKEYKVPSNP